MFDKFHWKRDDGINGDNGASVAESFKCLNAISISARACIDIRSQIVPSGSDIDSALRIVRLREEL
jgi:hypothetical protein